MLARRSFRLSLSYLKPYLKSNIEQEHLRIVSLSFLFSINSRETSLPSIPIIIHSNILLYLSDYRSPFLKKEEIYR